MFSILTKLVTAGYAIEFDPIISGILCSIREADTNRLLGQGKHIEDAETAFQLALDIVVHPKLEKLIKTIRG